MTNCATLAALSERVAARSEHVVFVERAPRSVELVVARADGAWTAELDISAPPPVSAARRTLRAQSCSALLDAVAFVVAVTLDPPNAERGSGSEGEVTPPANGDGSATAETTPGKGRERAAEPSAGERGTSSNQTRPGDSFAVQSADEEPEGDLQTYYDVEDAESLRARESRRGGPSNVSWSLGLLGQWGHAAAPNELFGVGAFARVQWRHGWRPSVNFGGAWLPAREWRTPAGVASFELAAFHLDACPFGTQLGAVDLGICASAVAARLIAKGERALEAERHERPWGFWGGGAFAQLDLAALDWAPLQLGLALRAGPVWVRDAFQFAPVVFYQVPEWGAACDLGIGIMLP